MQEKNATLLLRKFLNILESHDLCRRMFRDKKLTIYSNIGNIVIYYCVVLLYRRCERVEIVDSLFPSDRTKFDNDLSGAAGGRIFSHE